MRTFLLSDICKIEIGRTPARANPLFWGGKNPWLSISDMGKSRDIYTTKEGITDLGTETFNGRIVKPGTLLFSFKLSIGKIGIARIPLYTNEAIAALHIKDRLLACEEYLYYALQGLNFDTETDRAVMGKTLNKKKLAQINIPLPPLQEQKRIAAILDKADSIRRSRQKAIALTEELLRSTFLDMFGDPVTNPKGWDVVRFGSQLAELKYGTNAKCSELQEKEDIPVLRIPNIAEEKISWSGLKYAHLESSEIDKLLLMPNDLLFVRSNGNPDYIGRCALFEGGEKKAVYASYLIRARLNSDSEFCPAFIRDIVSFPTFRSRLTREARTTAGNYNINTQGLKSLKLISPPREKQEKYLNFGEKVSERLETEHNHLSHSIVLFNSLLQKAFRGEL